MSEINLNELPEFQELQNRLVLSEQNRSRLKKKIGRPLPEEENYVWTMLDLMTLLLIFFIIFYARTQIKQQHSAPLATKIVSDLLPDNPIETKKRSQPAWSYMVSPQKALKRKAWVRKPWNNPKKIWDKDALSDQLEKNLLQNLPAGSTKPYQILNEENKIIVVLGEQITFLPGQAEIIDSFQPTLKTIAKLISTRLTCKIEIAGHTDDTPIHTAQFPSNWELASERAIQVAKFLIAYGVSPHQISTRAFAEYSPRYENTSENNRKANRRVEIALIDR